MPKWDVTFDLEVDLARTELVKLVERAHALASVIREIPIAPYLQIQLDAMNISRAVRGTTAIEGAQASTQEVHEIMNSPGKRILPEARGAEEQEIRNAQAAMFHIARLIKDSPDRPLTESLILELHKLITADIPYENNVPGKYRSHLVHAGNYLPPETGEEVRRLMTEFVDWFNSPPVSNWDSVIRALVAHFYLISIHPFGDGNGRTSRAVESYLLYQGKVNARGFYSLANYYYQNRSKYVSHLDNARFNSENDLTPFVLFALKGLVSELEQVHQDVVSEMRIISFRDFARETFLSHGLLGSKAGSRGFQFLMGLGHDPVPMSDVYALPLYEGLTRRTVQRDIKFLRQHELVVIDDNTIRLNVDIMSQFTAIEEIEKGVIWGEDERHPVTNS